MRVTCKICIWWQNLKEKRAQQRHKDRTEGRLWFAWYPVFDSDHKVWIFRENVHCQLLRSPLGLTWNYFQRN